MRISRMLLVLAAAAMLTGCGDRNLIVNVDVLSYLDPAVTQIALGPVPPQGGGGVYTGEIAVIEGVEVNLIDGTSSVAEVQNITIRMGVVSTGVSGSGADTLRLYLAEPGQDPVVMGPVATVPMTFSPGVTETFVVESSGDSRIADLFTGQRILMTLTNSLRGPEFGDFLNANIEITVLDATLVAGRKGL